jgi:hypothetical protein
MPGTNAGTGNPISFRCYQCRRMGLLHRLPSGTLVYRSDQGRVNRVVLTGRKRATGHGRGYRKSDFVREYLCLDCGHFGWSNHADLEHLRPPGPGDPTPICRGSGA